MHITLTSMKRAFPKLNRKPYTFSDVQHIASRERITVTICDYNPDILGYYCTRKTGRITKKFIVINSKLDEVGRTFVGLHELVHHFLHSPASARQWLYCRRLAEGTAAKHDCEADNVALIAMIPFWMLCEFEAAGVNPAYHPSLVDLLHKRWKIWQQYSI